jgi:hypothetical protein
MKICKSTANCALIYKHCRILMVMAINILLLLLLLLLQFFIISNVYKLFNQLASMISFLNTYNCD